LILNPQIHGRKGLITNNNKLTLKEWIIDVEFALGDDTRRSYGGEGIGIFFTEQ